MLSTLVIALEGNQIFISVHLFTGERSDVQIMWMIHTEIWYIVKYFIDDTNEYKLLKIAPCCNILNVKG